MQEYDFVVCVKCDKEYRTTRGSMNLKTAKCLKCGHRIKYPDDIVGDAPRTSRTKIIRMR